MSAQRVELQPQLTGIALAYRNELCIADRVLPRVKVDKLSFQYYKYEKGMFLTLPETKVGEKGEANKIEIKAKLETETVDEHALEESISIARQNEAQGEIENLETTATVQLTDVLKLRREVDLAKILSNSENYDGNFQNVSTKISTDTTNAVKLITTAMDKMIRKPNRLVTSRKAFSALRQNPFILSAVNRNNSTSGIASVEAIKDLFDLKEILVGESVVNTSKNKQALNPQACWGNDIILLSIDENATAKYGMTFGYNAYKDDISILKYTDMKYGTQGADILKAYMSEKYLITCPECGYLLQGVI